MTVQIWPWADSHQSSGWPWLHNVSTSATLAKGDDYRGAVMGGLIRQYICNSNRRYISAALLMALPANGPKVLMMSDSSTLCSDHFHSKFGIK
jgi:hypothetical protein